jgi:hypothetical protein
MRLKLKVAGSLVFLLACCLLTYAREESLDQLMAKADAASAGDQADLCMQVADRELKLALDAYKANKPDQGHTALDQIVKYSDKARSAAIQSGKKLKHTEIKIRNISKRLRDLRANAEPDDQTVIQAAIDKLESFRTALLNSMFGSKSHD